MPSTDPSEFKICETLTYICLYGKNVAFLPSDLQVLCDSQKLTPSIETIAENHKP